MAGQSFFRQVLLPAILFLGISALCATQEMRAQTDRDELNAAVTVPAGCFDLSLLNGNASKKTIDKLALEIITPGFTWVSRVKAPNPWTVTSPTPGTLLFSGDAKPLDAGRAVVFKHLCLDPVCQQFSVIEVAWQTFDGNTMLTSDTLLLSCSPMDRFDTVAVRDSSGAHLLTVFNRNSAGLFLNGFMVTSLTPGIPMASKVHNGWSINDSSGTSVTYNTLAGAIRSGDALSGFVIVPDTSGAGPGLVSFGWATLSDDRIISIGEFSYGSAPDPLCDTLSMNYLHSGPAGDSNSYALTMFNRHTPPGPLDLLRLSLLTPGIAFTAAAGPWTANVTGTSIDFVAGASTLHPGDSLPGFTCAMTNAGPSDSAVIVWLTLSRGTVACIDTLTVYCPVTVRSVCDSLTTAQTERCSFSLRFLNRHLPATPLNAFSIEIPGSDALIAEVLPPPGWTVDSAAGGYFMAVKQSGGVDHGSLSPAFDVTFTSLQEGTPFAIHWATWNAGRALCEGDRLLLCESAGSSCDTLLVQNSSPRDFTFAVKNIHQPASDIATISFQIMSGNAALLPGNAPASWSTDSVASDFIRFVHSGGGLPPGEEAAGFELRFIENTDSLVTLQWCSSDVNGVICCRPLSVSLPPWRECDSLQVGPGPTDCSAWLVLWNTHSSGTPVDRLSISLLTPDTQLDVVAAPQEWNAFRVNDTSAYFEHEGSGLPAGSQFVKFIMSVVQGAENRMIEFQWCSWSGDSVICCDESSFLCTGEETGCDVISMNTDSEAPCCFELNVRNQRGVGTVVDSVSLHVLTPGVLLYHSTVRSPIGWQHTGTGSNVFWSSPHFGIANGFDLDGFKVCFDNDGTGNEGFEVEVWTYDRQDVRCVESFVPSCDVTLSVSSWKPEPEMRLQQNYPNPFNPATTLLFDPGSRTYIVLEILDATGNVVQTAAEGFYEAGTHSASFDGEDLPSGIYFARLRSNGRSLIRAMMLLR